MELRFPNILLLLGFTEAHHTLSYLFWITSIRSHVSHHVPHYSRHHARHELGTGLCNESHTESASNRSNGKGKHISSCGGTQTVQSAAPFPSVIPTRSDQAAIRACDPWIEAWIQSHPQSVHTRSGADSSSVRKSSTASVLSSMLQWYKSRGVYRDV